jgi:2-iminoacetate synthase ThiH
MARAPSSLSALLRAAEAGRRPDAAEALTCLVDAPTAELLPVVESLTLAGFGETVTYSRKVFIPLAQLCRDVCHYCTFAKAPRHLRSISHRRGGTRDSARGEGRRLLFHAPGPDQARFLNLYADQVLPKLRAAFA